LLLLRDGVGLVDRSRPAAIPQARVIDYSSSLVCVQTAFPMGSISRLTSAEAVRRNGNSRVPAYAAIVFDAGYGVVLPLLSELEKRRDSYLAQVPSNVAAWPADAVATLVQPKVGRPRQHAVVRDPAIRPQSMVQWRERLPQACWKSREHCPAPITPTVRAVPVRVRASQRASRWRQPGVLRWLLVEELADSTFKYHLSNLPEDTPLEELVRLAHQRWAIGQGYQQLKEELGLEHFEGRSWRGFTITSPSAFLPSASSRACARQKKLPSLPEVRRWLIEALTLCACPRCRTRFTRSGVILDSS
jgi:SRSO17 transposase